MTNYRFITDSACDIPDDALAAYPEITILSIPLVVDGQDKRERRDYTLTGFYDALEQAKELPTTAHITMVEFFECYERAVEEGADRLVVVTITSKGSNMYSAACMARDNFFEEHPEQAGRVTIDVIDSRTYTVLYGCALMEAADMAREGREHQLILAHLSSIPERMDVYFTIFNLDHAKKSGRISFAAAFVGELLGLRPLMTIRDGQVTMVGKIRGDRQVLQKMADNYKTAADGSKNYPYVLLQGNRDDMMAEFKDILKRAKAPAEKGLYHIGASITINAGPTLIGIIFPRKD